MNDPQPLADQLERLKTWAERVPPKQHRAAATAIERLTRELAELVAHDLTTDVVTHATTPGTTEDDTLAAIINASHTAGDYVELMTMGEDPEAIVHTPGPSRTDRPPAKTSAVSPPDTYPRP